MNVIRALSGLKWPFFIALQATSQRRRVYYGGLARHLEHPDSVYHRVYRVRAFGLLDPSAVTDLERGAVVDGIAYAPAMVEVLRGAPGWQQGG